MQFQRISLAALCLSTLAAFAATPVHAGDFSLMGSYWDTDVAGETAGGGVILGLPLNESFAIELRATYFEQLSDDALENAFHSHDPVFLRQGIQALPLEAGVRIGFAPGATFRPYVGGGASYFLLDSDFGEIQDELGYYAALGATVGDGRGAEFFFEGLYRKATAHVKIDPQHFDDIDDINVDDEAALKLDGLGVNAGVRWTF
jgi:hypothetical protein